MSSSHTGAGLGLVGCRAQSAELRLTKRICRPALDHRHPLLEEGVAVDGDEEGAGACKESKFRSALLQMMRSTAWRPGADDLP